MKIRPGPSEVDKRRRAGIRAMRWGRRRNRRARFGWPLALLLGGAFITPGIAQTLPQGGSIAGGLGSIQLVNPNLLTVRQNSQNLAIDWQSFNVGPSSVVRFEQPSASAIALNRVIGSDPSTIYGRIQANGQVILLNPNGIHFGPNSVIDVNALVATTANVRSDDFMAGRLRFDEASGDPNARIVNEGLISVAQGGFAVLAAAGVSNTGRIVANGGTVVLTGTETFTLDFHGDGLLSFAATGAVGRPPAAAAALVDNSGTVEAHGGRVLLTARAARDVLDNVINTTGIVVARSAQTVGGEIVIDGGENGIVRVDGSVDASGHGAGETGGTVKVLGERVGLFAGARIDAAGEAGGGTVLVGGNYLGRGPEANARSVYMDARAVIDASAAGSGDGGRVILWSDEYTNFQGTISARRGGFVETSSKDRLDIRGGRVDVGAGGQWLLDPRNITLANATAGGNFSGGNPDVFTPVADDAQVDVSTIVAALDAGTDVTIQTGGTGAQGGDIVIAPATSIAVNSVGTRPTLRLVATRDIRMSAGSAITASGTGLNVIFNANSTAMSNGPTSASFGAIEVLAGSRIDVNAGYITLGGGINPLGNAAPGIAARGHAGGSGSGIVVGDNTVIRSGDGNIYMIGQGSRSGNARAVGIDMSGSGAKTISSNRWVGIYGYGGDGVSAVAHGIDIRNASITGGGGIGLWMEINGYGGNGGSAAAVGVNIQDSTLAGTMSQLNIYAVGGDAVTADATAVRIRNSVITTAGGSGQVNVTGRGGRGAPISHGIENFGDISSDIGGLTLIGTAGDPSPIGIAMDAHGYVGRAGSILHGDRGAAVSLTGRARTATNFGIVLEGGHVDSRWSANPGGDIALYADGGLAIQPAATTSRIQTGASTISLVASAFDLNSALTINTTDAPGAAIRIVPLQPQAQATIGTLSSGPPPSFEVSTALLATMSGYRTLSIGEGQVTSMTVGDLSGALYPGAELNLRAGAGTLHFDRPLTLPGTGSLTARSSGNVSQAAGAALTVSGQSSFTSDAGSILLGNATNDLRGPVSFDARTGGATLANATGAVLGSVRTGGTFDLSLAAGGAVTQNLALNVGSELRVTGADSVVLNNGQNLLVGAISLDAPSGDVHVVNNRETRLGRIVAGTSLDVYALGGALLQNPVVAPLAISVGGATSLQAGGTIYLGEPNNLFAGAIGLSSTGVNNATVANTFGGLTSLGPISVNGTLTLSFAGSISQSAPLHTGNLTVAAGRSVNLLNPANSMLAAAVTASGGGLNGRIGGLAGAAAWANVVATTSGPFYVNGLDILGRAPIVAPPPGGQPPLQLPVSVLQPVADTGSPSLDLRSPSSVPSVRIAAAALLAPSQPDDPDAPPPVSRTAAADPAAALSPAGRWIIPGLLFDSQIPRPAGAPGTGESDP
jgi:filamentous hemagglutinin family protein